MSQTITFLCYLSPPGSVLKMLLLISFKVWSALSSPWKVSPSILVSCPETSALLLTADLCIQVSKMPITSSTTMHRHMATMATARNTLIILVCSSKLMLSSVSRQAPARMITTISAILKKVSRLRSLDRPPRQSNTDSTTANTSMPRMIRKVSEQGTTASRGRVILRQMPMNCENLLGNTHSGSMYRQPMKASSIRQQTMGMALDATERGLSKRRPVQMVSVDSWISRKKVVSRAFRAVYSTVWRRGLGGLLSGECEMSDSEICMPIFSDFSEFSSVRACFYFWSFSCFQNARHAISTNTSRSMIPIIAKLLRKLLCLMNRSSLQYCRCLIV